MEVILTFMAAAAGFRRTLPPYACRHLCVTGCALIIMLVRANGLIQVEESDSDRDRHRR